jgi:hypothetical protein
VPLLVQKYRGGGRDKEMNGCWDFDPIREGIFYKFF